MTPDGLSGKELLIDALTGVPTSVSYRMLPRVVALLPPTPPAHASARKLTLFASALLVSLLFLFLCFTLSNLNFTTVHKLTF